MGQDHRKGRARRFFRSAAGSMAMMAALNFSIVGVARADVAPLLLALADAGALPRELATLHDFGGHDGSTYPASDFCVRCRRAARLSSALTSDRASI